MTITEREMESVKRIVVDGANRHFPSTVRFQDANVTVRLDIQDEEYLDVQLLYTAPHPVLDGDLMITLYRVIDDPLRAAGITMRTSFRFTDINDPTRPENRKAPSQNRAAP